jgi:hypothetical protein
VGMEKNGQLTVLADHYEGKRLKRSGRLVDHFARRQASRNHRWPGAPAQRRCTYAPKPAYIAYA